ncbi:MAG: phosphatase PAP2 family protein, partial [Dokdonella sp.]
MLLSTGLAMAAAWIFLSILESVVSAGLLIFADSRIYQGLQHLRSPFRDSVIVAITELGDPLVVAAVAITVSLWLVFRRRWRAAAYWVGAILIAQILNTFTKLIVQRPRPGIFDYAEASRFSFPSGHATMNSVMYAFLALL